MRLFVAVLPPPEALRELETAVTELTVRRAGLLRPENWHLTVTFLGEIPDDRVQPVSAAVAAGAAAGRAGELSLRGGGHFGRTVLWVGVSGDIDALSRTARAVAREVRKARVKLERRPYHPHLTLARPRHRISAAEFDADLARLTAYEGPTWAADRLHLFRSQQVRTPEGQLTKYDALASWALPRHQA